jgi:hypothetical protein
MAMASFAANRDRLCGGGGPRVTCLVVMVSANVRLCSAFNRPRRIEQQFSPLVREFTPRLSHYQRK